MAREKKVEGENPLEVQGASAIAVYGADGKYVRTYTTELHGERIVELAEGFAVKIGGTTKKAV